MKKYIFTEEQIRGIIDQYINEQITASEIQILKIPDLAQIMARIEEEPDQRPFVYEVFLQTLLDVYRSDGDTGVMEFFKLATKVNIEPMGHGRYTIK